MAQSYKAGNSPNAVYFVAMPYENSVRRRVHEIIFGTDTPAGRGFDIALLILIMGSVLAVVLESVPSIDRQYHELLLVAEWTFTILFTLEYLARIWAERKPWSYIFSFYGLVDFLSILPTYLSLFFAGTHVLSVIRALRLLRIFRILKLGRYSTASQTILLALAASRRKIMVFVGSVLVIVLIVGSIMYLVEGSINPSFSSIPKSIYWAIVTITTVGYGDITPVTGFGQFISAMLMIMGYGIIAVPTGIVTVEYSKVMDQDGQTAPITPDHSCWNCGTKGHKNGASFCFHCGEPLQPD